MLNSICCIALIDIGVGWYGLEGLKPSQFLKTSVTYLLLTIEALSVFSNLLIAPSFLYHTTPMLIKYEFLVILYLVMSYFH